ncbi:MAG: hypothetical protein IKX56_04920, partial [Muribaculaceae bacterium]|nr:hypothetical protein [Muribaculaceae bacterium]
MKRKKILFILALLLTTVSQGAWADDGWSVWNGGEIYFTHEPANPPTVVDNWVQINSAEDLVYVTLNWTKCLDGRTDLGVYYKRNYQLNVNLDFTSVTWKPLGYYGHGEHEDKGLEGFFNGNGHTIKLKIENTSENNQGLFHEIHSSGKVWNLHVDCDIRVGNARLVGGIAGENYGTIQNCWVSGHIESSHYSQYDADLGGIAGLNEDEGDILYCCVTANVTNTGGNSGVGGIAGSNEGEIYHVTFYGDVSVNHAQYNKYVGKQNQQATLEYYYDTFNQTEYDTAGPEDQNQNLYAYAIKYPYAINVTTVGQGSLTVSAGGENNVPGARKGQEVTLTTPSGINADVTVTDAEGNNVMLFGSSSASGYSFIMPKSDVNVHAVFSVPNWPGCTTGTGESGDPYIITSADDWNEFALSVNAGNTHIDKHVKLNSDISIWMMAGASEANSFQGTFDGNGHTLTVSYNTSAAVTAPFRYTNDATISDL